MNSKFASIFLILLVISAVYSAKSNTNVMTNTGGSNSRGIKRPGNPHGAPTHTISGGGKALAGVGLAAGLGIAGAGLPSSEEEEPKAKPVAKNLGGKQPGHTVSIPAGSGITPPKTLTNTQQGFGHSTYT
uniref:Glycine-rich secreted salivary protein n=1 Tax=Xenopsylla cheopis TaxID=163159 RepID=A2IAB8_XENCH|nr:glycine-rich secreted salivary protein [Xenopsylla cheopis]